MKHYSSNKDFSSDSINTLDLKKQNTKETPSEKILAFKNTVLKVIDKYLNRINRDPMSGALSIFVRIIIKLLTDMVGEPTFFKLLKK